MKAGPAGTPARRGRWHGTRKKRDRVPKTLVSAGDVLAGVLKRTGYDPREYALFELWDRLLGREAVRARAVGLKNNRLYVEVDTSVRLYGLTLRKRDILKKLNAAFGGTAPLSDIILRIGAPSPSDDKHAENR